MQSPRRPSKNHEYGENSPADVSGLSLRSPIKRHSEKENAPSSRSPVKRTPRSPKNNGTPNSNESFITSSPTPKIRSLRFTQRTRAPRTPSGTLFSPSYVPTLPSHSPFDGEIAHTTIVFSTTQVDQASPTRSSPISPVRYSLQENLARYGHMPQQFDEYEQDQFDPYQFIASLQVQSISHKFCKVSKPSCLPPKLAEIPHLTLVLDLDETLVHCSTDPREIILPDFTFEVVFNGVTYKVNAKKRPGFDEFMEHIKGRFEIVVFTASQRVYAEKLLDILDPLHEYFNHRLFRDDCLNVEGNYLKDLTYLGRDLAKTMIVDNSPQAFSFQIDNGIPILSWFDSADDRELFKVCPLLDKLLSVQDVRPILRDTFELYKKVEEKLLFSCPLDGIAW